jgi:hypothetical protein
MTGVILIIIMNKYTKTITMKKLIFILTLFYGSMLFGQNMSWKAMNVSTPSGWHVGSISTIDTQIVWGALFRNNFTGDQVFRTLDGGQTHEVFTLPSQNAGALSYHVHALHADTAFVAVSSANGHKIEGLFRTVDGGQNWTKVFDAQQHSVAVFQVHFFSSLEGTIMCNDISSGSISSLFYYTTDGGDNWTQSTGVFQSPCIYFESLGKAYAAVGDTIWYSGGIKNLIFRSVDKGKTWVDFPLPGGQNASILDIAFQNHQEGLAISSFLCGVGDRENMVFQTKDGGSSWTFLTNIQLPTSGIEANNLSYVPGSDSFYLVGSGLEPADRGYYLSRDGGKTWSAHFALATIYDFTFLSPTEGFAATSIANGGLLRFTGNLEAQSTNISATLTPEQFQVFPNPAQTFVQFTLNIPGIEEFTLSLYAFDGRKLREQTFRSHGAAAVYNLSVEGVSSGPYQLIISSSKGRIGKVLLIE